MRLVSVLFKSYLSMISPACVCDKLCQYFSFLSMFMDLFCIVVKYLQCSFLNFSPFYLFISKFIIMFSVTCSTESVMLSCFNKILYLILNLEKTRLFLDCCVRRVLEWGDVIMRYIVPSCFVMWGGGCRIVRCHVSTCSR